MNNDLKRFVEVVNNATKIPINQNQFDALVSFAYNMGVKGFKDSLVVKSINLKRKKENIKANWNLYQYSKGKKLEGLANRRKDEIELYFNGDYSQKNKK